ncbi:MAG: hypothetical protein FWD18_06580 [Micrococcales bacterium]|nr:hypothetical protein [Micrococcales bacterium]
MSASLVEGIVLGLVALAMGGWGVLVVRRHPAVAVVGFLVVLMLVPAWLVIPIGVDLAPTMLVGLGIVIGMFGLDAVKPSSFDIVLIGLVAVAAIMAVMGFVTANSLYWLALWWLVPYLVGRTLAMRGQVQTVYDVVAVLVAIVAALAIVESLSGSNFFTERLGVGSHWEKLQYRGGRVRAEGAFGHSIALGATLGMAIPLVWASRWRPWFRVVTIAVVSVAAFLTFSRIGMLTTIVALVGSFLLLRNEMPSRVRWTIAAAGLAVAAVLIPTVIRVFDDAGSEATESSGYRVFLLELVPKMAAFGQASSPATQLRSIDSEPILFGVRFGLIPLIFLLLCVAVGVIVALRRPNPALVSFIAVLPGLTSVAFITQFTAFFWFVLGIGVSVLVARGSPEPDEPPDEPGTVETQEVRQPIG